MEHRLFAYAAMAALIALYLLWHDPNHKKNKARLDETVNEFVLEREANVAPFNRNAANSNTRPLLSLSDGLTADFTHDAATKEAESESAPFSNEHPAREEDSRLYSNQNTSNEELDSISYAPLDDKIYSTPESQHAAYSENNGEVLVEERFVKMDQQGKLLSVDAQQWSCVFDQNTGLIWEVKSAKPGIHYRENRYVWANREIYYNHAIFLDKEYDGCFLSNEAAEEEIVQCGTELFEQSVNSEKLCGYQNWRLPSIEELQTIVINRGEKTVVDRLYFPNTQRGYYWSGEYGAYGEKSSWALRFSYNTTKNDIKVDNPIYIRLVTKYSGQYVFQSPVSAKPTTPC